MNRTAALWTMIAVLGLPTASFAQEGEEEPPPAEGASEGPSGEEPLSRRERRQQNWDWSNPDMPGNQRIGWERRRQVPFVRNGGTLNRHENAIVLYADGELLPPAVMISYQRGLLYWLTVGFDIGGDAGVFQALLRIKQEMARTRTSNFFFWGWHIRTGFKYVDVDYRSTNEDLFFQDTSWVLSFENTFAFRFGRHRRRVVYINTMVYGDFDLSRQDHQNDLYIMPATLGFETIIGRSWNFFIEAGVAIAVNGWETEVGVIGDNDIFPLGSLGFAYRWGGVRTALPDNWRDPSALPMR